MERITHIRSLALALLFAVATMLNSCIKNDIPYPIVELSITSIEGVGFTMNTPDYTNRIITLQLDETTDIANVEITKVEYTTDAELSEPLIGTFDMRTPLYVTLSLYQDYEWTIVAEQNIDRSFKVAGQIGEEIIDVENLTAKVYVTQSIDLKDISILELKLGPSDITTYSPSIDEITSFESYRTVTVKYYSTTQVWRLYVDTTDVVVEISQFDVWAKRAYLAAAGDSSGECGFRYRTSGGEWIEVSGDQIATTEGSFSTVVTSLTPETTYEFVAFTGDDVSESIVASSEEEAQLPNGDFEEWSKPANPWLPYLDSSTRFWDTGNTGATTLGSTYNITTPCYDDLRSATTGEVCAQLESKYIIVKFAAGNIFTGRFVEIIDANGIIAFGQQFSQRPTALRGWVKYNQGIIDKVSKVPTGVSVTAGVTPDTGIIYAALGTWTPEEYGMCDGSMLGTTESPIIIDTRNESSFFSPTSDAVISYGELLLTESQDEWMEFTIPLDYRSTSIIPTHLVIVASSSIYGDYFTGSTSSVMWVDDFELIYE